jgi:opacity protein-like surface antigen
MCKRLYFALLLLVFVPSVCAQETPKLEVFAGYSDLNFDARNLNGGMGGLPNDRPNVSGWEASGSFNVSDWFGLEADFSGHYYPNCEGVGGLTCKDLSFMGGPRLSYRKERYTAFTYGLFGGDNGSGGINGFSLSDTPFALAAGGGVDYSVTPHIAIRVAQVDYFMTRHALNLAICLPSSCLIAGQRV